MPDPLANAWSLPLRRLAGGLVVSCQADPGSPLRASGHINALAQAALLGGAVGLRIEGLDDVAAVRRTTDVPIIGLVKDRGDGEVYITPTVRRVEALADYGCEIVAVDATRRPRPEPLQDLIAAAHDAGVAVMADVSTAAEAQTAMALGADIVGTTLAGYTAYSRRPDGPDFELMHELRGAGIPFAAEGRIRDPREAAAALACGAAFVVVGSAITRPEVITRGFVAALRNRQPRSEEMK